MSGETTERVNPGEAQAAADAPKRRKRANADRAPQEWEQLAKAWRIWNPEPADAGPESLRKALFKIVDIALKRKGEARSALDVKASEWLAWLELSGNVETAPSDPLPSNAGVPSRSGEEGETRAQPPATPAQRSVVEDAPVAASVSTPVSAPAAGETSAPVPATTSASATASSNDAFKLAQVVSRRMDKLDAALRERVDAILKRQERAEDAGRRLEQSLTQATRSLPVLGERIQELERSSRGAMAALRELETATAASQQRVEANVQQLLERGMGAVRELAQGFGDRLDERLRAKIDLADVTRLLEVQQHVEERVQADIVRRASRRIAPALDALRAVLTEGDAGRTKSALEELCTACRTAGLVLDLRQLF